MTDEYLTSRNLHYNTETGGVQFSHCEEFYSEQLHNIFFVSKGDFSSLKNILDVIKVVSARQEASIGASALQPGGVEFIRN